MSEREGRVVLPDDVIRVVGAAAGVATVVLTGSRASGLANPWSDWDFKVVTADFASVRDTMPRIVAPLCPVAARWDRLSRAWCYMLILAGPVKVDLIFAQPHTPLPPWQPSAAALPGIDDHFWDWMLWLRSKQAAGRKDLVAADFGKLHQYLLAPLGVTTVPATLGQAVTAYQAARASWERKFGLQVPRTVEHTVIQALHP